MIRDSRSFENFKKDKKYKYDYKTVSNPEKYSAEKKSLGYEIYKEFEKMPSGKFRVHYRKKLLNQVEKDLEPEKPTKVASVTPKVTISQINKLVHRIKNSIQAIEQSLELPSPNPHWADWHLGCTSATKDVINLTKKAGIYWKIDNPLLAFQVYEELVSYGVKKLESNVQFSASKPMFIVLFYKN